MLWLALHLPGLPIEALPWRPTTAPGQDGRCVVDQGVVLAADASAQALGVQPGLSQATATALAPRVLQCPRDPLREAQFVHGLALALSVLTPHIVVEPDAVLLEVRGSLRLFGGVRRLLCQARHIAESCGATPQLGLAPTARAAQLLACAPVRRRRALHTTTAWRLLARLPLPAVLAAWGQPLRMVELLQAIGCRNVGDVRALPRAGVQRRGGRALLLALDQAFGDQPDPRRWFEPPAEFAAEVELMHRADDAQMLGHAAGRLVHMLAGWLSRQWLAASRLRLLLRHETGRHSVPDTPLLIDLGQPSRDAQHLMVMLSERLQRLELAAPVYGLRLRLDEARPCAGHEGSLLPDDHQRAQDFHALVDRLRARLGNDRILRVELHPDHRPQHAYASRCAAAPAAPGAPAVSPTMPPEAGQLGRVPRPAWLLPRPVPLAERQGRPLHGTQPLTVLTSAERIEAGWFDSAPTCRDYHVAEGTDHRLRWIYRERRGHDDQTGWYLHGLFG